MSGLINNMFNPNASAEAPTGGEAGVSGGTAFDNLNKGTSIRDFLSSPTASDQQGTVRNFLGRVSGDNSASATAPVVEPAQATGEVDAVGKVPLPQPRPKDYSAETLLPRAAHPELRNSILTGAGLNPEQFSSVPGADVLRKAMKKPDLRQQEYAQSDASQEIEAAVRPLPNQIQVGPNGKPANVQSAFKRKASLTGE
jgi:hypothetical protein